MTSNIRKLLFLIMILAIAFPGSAFINQSLSAKAAPPVPVTITILHTNDFHGQLEPAGSNPGMARVATKVNEVRAAKGAANVLLACTRQ